jgi:2-haloacid dehalogenase
VTRRTVTFDVYSALIDSRSGGSAAFATIARRYGWSLDGEELYVGWDGRNKAAHLAADGSRSFRDHATDATADLLASLGIEADAAVVTDELLASVPRWPHWPDVPDGLRAVGAEHHVALLSNIDDDVLAATSLGTEVVDAVTSQRARAYKPHRAIYDHARARFGHDLVHVPASARDVRGALEADVAVVRVVRPGHHVDPAGPPPEHEVDDLRDLPGVLARLTPRATGG